MSSKPNFPLEIRKTPQANVFPESDRGSWRLEIPSGLEGSYRLAQLDDYSRHARADFYWKPPVTLCLRARVSTNQLPGTWGFGFWNDPFSLSLGFGGGTRRFPALPNAAWFFFASPQNHLSFGDDLPAKGFMVQTFHAPKLPTALLALGALGLPLLFWPWLARKIRAWLHHLVDEDSFSFNFDLTEWHNYTLNWRADEVIFKLDGQIFKTRITPNGPLGFVLWIDNQYASFLPNGKFSYGRLTNPQPAWLEVDALSIRIEM